jgi:protein-disulfide isomerase/uncharacterized membrane protein
MAPEGTTSASKQVYHLLYWITALAIITGIVLSVVSWLRICSSSCSESHNWRFFGFSFEFLGLVAFIVVLIFHLLSKRYPDLSFYTGLMLIGAVGAELKLVFIQKYIIKAWCPICLSIAACIFIGAACFTIKYLWEFMFAIKQRNKEDIMDNIWKGISAISVFILGFLLAIIGVIRFDPLEAAENTIKDSIAFGDLKSPIEIYVFTDWACPACRQIEPELEKMAPNMMKQARITFVDHAVHTETLNYSPYNVSFMIKNKPEYMKLREALTQLSIDNSAPTDEQIEKVAEKLGTKYQQLHFADITLSQKYFKQLAKQFGISKTPTLVIINRETKKGKKLIGSEITEENVLKAIQALKGGTEEDQDSESEESESEESQESFLE